MEYRTLKIERKGKILIVQINRPKKMNALSIELMHELDSLLDAVEIDKTISVAIITGNENSFAAGGDISEMLVMDEPTAVKASHFVQQTFTKIGLISKPVIAAIDGLAYGGGCELAMACDFCIASENARFALPESSLHILPGGGGSQRLSRIAGLQNALYLLLSGIEINVQTALCMGIVQKISTSNRLLEETIKLAEIIANKPAETISTIKKTVRGGFKIELEKALEMEANAFGKLVGSVGKDAMKAFFERRKKD